MSKRTPIRVQAAVTSSRWVCMPWTAWTSDEQRRANSCLNDVKSSRAHLAASHLRLASISASLALWAADSASSREIWASFHTCVAASISSAAMQTKAHQHKHEYRFTASTSIPQLGQSIGASVLDAGIDGW